MPEGQQQEEVMVSAVVLEGGFHMNPLQHSSAWALLQPECSGTPEAVTKPTGVAEAMAGCTAKW